MGWSSFSTYRGRRRGIGRAAAFLLIISAILVAGGCGKKGDGAETDPDKGSDASILNAALARERTILDVYGRTQPLLRGSLRPLGRQLRAQEQEYVNALTKAIRGLGGDTEAGSEEVSFAGVRGRADFLTLLYELESAALAAYVDDAPRLYTSAPRTLATSLAAGHAQHLVVLRQALGANLAESVPEAFDSGEVPPPATANPSGEG